MPAARAAAVAAAAFSRLCAPGISGSAGSVVVGARTRRGARRRARRRSRAARRRRRRRSGSRRSAAWRRGTRSKLPCRSRWSGSRLSSTAIRGRKRSTSSSWKLESSQTIHSSAGDVADELAERGADVPGGAGAEHRAEQLGRRRLAVRAGDADDRVREQSRRQLDLAPDGDPALARRHDERRLARHARALDQHLDAVEQGEILVVAERPVGRDDLGAARLERGLRGPARAREPEHEDALHSRNWR